MHNLCVEYSFVLLNTILVLQDQRRLSFQSKNAEAAKHDLYEKAKGTVHPSTTYSTSSKCISPICPGNYDLDSSGNLRPSPVGVVGRGRSRGSKLAVLQQSLHGKEVSFVSHIKSDVYVYKSL